MDASARLPMETNSLEPKSRLSALRSVLLPNCREMSRLTSRRLDHPLTLFQRVGAGLHLLFCRLCRRYRKHLDWVRAASRHPRAGFLPGPGLAEASRIRLKHLLKVERLAAKPGAGSGSLLESP